MSSLSENIIAGLIVLIIGAFASPYLEKLRSYLHEKISGKKNEKKKIETPYKKISIHDYKISSNKSSCDRKVFISHNSSDTEILRRLAGDLGRA